MPFLVDWIESKSAQVVSEAKSYEVHVLMWPEGYVYPSDEVFHTDKKASDLTIVLKKAD